ncbi:MAG TPA: BBP7 family outer membrane beta-barrel protein, partial [Urbifossiella sp.]|nr:BBP7 family outer membrane beta-barrel protein [Urbifossiella sp.]
ALLAQTVVLDSNFKPVPLAGGAFIALRDVTDTAARPGLRARLGFRITDDTSVELGYFGLQQWARVATLTVGDPPFANSPFLGSAIIYGNKSFDTSITARYSSEIHSAEANIRESFDLGDWSASALGGVRYFNLSEQISLTGLQTFPQLPGGPPPASQTISEQTRTVTNNNLFGAQVGAEVGRFWLDDRVGLSVNGKVGIFANNASQNTTNGARPVTGGGVGTTTLATGGGSTDFASLYEGGIATTVRVTSRITVRGGYQTLYVRGLALAPTQLLQTGTAIQKSSLLVPGSFMPAGVPVPATTYPPPGTGAGLNTNGNVFFHGPFAGLTIIF